ncbi:methyltransferase, partial [Streptomyces triticagri]
VDQTLVTTTPDADGNPQLTAYLTQPTHTEPATEHTGDQVDRWGEVFDQIYEAGDQQTEDPTYDISGWISSYTGEPLPAHEMREWVDSVVGRIKSLPHRRVLEIGCGTGLLLFRIAPDAELYCGTDVSAVALRDLQAKLPLLPEGSARVELRECPADRFDGFDEDSFDTVVINSVAQYFPDVAYFVDVLTQAARVVRPGGSIVIGDVRNLALQEQFHTSLHLARTPGDADDPAALAAAVADRVAQDAELVLDPKLFTAFAAARPEIDGVSLLAKPSPHRNELTKYRYDVVLHIRDDAQQPGTPAAAAGTGTGESEELWDATPVEQISQRLERDRPSRVRIAGVEDARLSADRTAAGRDAAGPELDPAELARAVTALGYRAVPALRPDRPGQLDLVIAPEGGPLPTTTADAEAAGAGFEAFANDPADASRRASLVPELRGHLKHRLPEYMVPQHFMVLEAWPLNANGKLDRKALPLPRTGDRKGGTAAYVAPRTALERSVATVWADVLGVSRVGVLDNFFDLGGHSLLATRVCARIGEACGAEVPLGDFFQYPTVAGLAAHIEESGARRERGPAIRRADRSRRRRPG